MTLIPTRHLRWNKGVLEEHFQRTDGALDFWSPVPTLVDPESKAEQEPEPQQGSWPMRVRRKTKELEAYRYVSHYLMIPHWLTHMRSNLSIGYYYVSDGLSVSGWTEERFLEEFDII